MEDGPPMFRQDFTCPALLEDKMLSTRTGLSPTMARLSRRFRFLQLATGLVRVRSPLLTESRLMSFPPATEMFHFAGFASLTYVFSYDDAKAPGCPIRKSTDQRVLSPPRAYRRVPRPSSPLDAKASTKCSFHA